MSHRYERLPDPGAGLRLHLNENTAGCSERVLAAMRAVTRQDAAFYPDYDEVQSACARYFGVARERLLVTNGLDEGIHAASFAYLQRGEDGSAREAIIVEPAFDMYAACADAAGGRIVQIPPRSTFVFPLDEVLRSITTATRIVYLTSPNNPTGLSIPAAAIRTIALRLPTDALLFLDEAYADFAASSFLPERDDHRNVLVGRTFAKAHGLAAVRAGVVIAHPEVIARLRRVVAPYSVNVFAIAGLRAAVNDREYLHWYRDQVAQSREILYALFERLGLSYWPSEANFVLVRVGPGASELVRAVARRGVFIRDRSGEPGCEGCVRVTAGVVEHTERCVAVLEDELCAAR